MIEAIAFDTHRFVKNLTAGGFTEQQAETLADEQVHLLNANLATKADIQNLAAKTDMQNANLATKAEIQAVKADLLKWMVTAMTAQTGLIAGLIVGLVRFF